MSSDGSRELVEPQVKSAFASVLMERLREALVTPVKALRWQYLPLLMVYFSYGALGVIGVAESFWVKSATSMSPADLAALAVWTTIPWTVKMVFGQLVDSVPLLGSRRRAYVFVGAGLIAAGLVTLAGAAGKWITVAGPEALYVFASLLIVIGVVLQDVVADAMSTEVVARVEADGTPRPKDEVRRDLGMVQVLGRLALSFGIFATAGVAGWLAKAYSYETVFWLGLAIPAISVTGAMLVRLESTEKKPIDWRILGGGLVFGLVVAGFGLSQVPYGQEIVFIISMAVIIAMLIRVTDAVSAEVRHKILFASIVIFAFRATPGTGEGYRWFTIDVLGFDEAFYGTLAQVGAGLSMLGIWLLSDTITRRPIAQTLFWLTLIGAVLSLPNVVLVYELHHWTERVLGFGARTIAMIDTTVESPFAQLSMIPMLTLIAIHAPEGRRATWFALMASLMNLALVAGSLQTKYLNQIFDVQRGQYDDLAGLIWIVLVLGLLIPLSALALFGRKVT